MKRNYIKYAVIVFVMLIAGVIYSCGRGEHETYDLSATREEETAGSNETTATEETEAENSVSESGTSIVSDSQNESNTVKEVFNPTVCVYVCGAVNKPDVYELGEDKRVVDAVKAAGGFAENADMDYINLADTLIDGEKIYVPTEDEVAENKVPETSAAITTGTGTLQSTGAVTGTSVTGKVNINTATAEELKTLNGIGDKRAQDIINYRNTHEKFKTIEDIMLVPGIKNAAFEKICDYIEV